MDKRKCVFFLADGSRLDVFAELFKEAILRIYRNMS